MPVNVPTEPKKYTTVYENFKGVDFTNDPSNVYKRRSPGGKNMLPDLDGRPYKRKGWKVEYSAKDFIDAAGSSATTVTPKRIHHFALGGKEYLMMFNSLGVFYTAEDMDTVVKCQLATIDDDEIVTSAFPPQIDGVSLEADSGRTFFFESEGTAGLYTFVGTSLFRFDGQYYWEVDPYIPVLLVACDVYGAGTFLENINLLTPMRTVQYLCDGTTTDFIVPGGINTSAGYTVELMTVTGEWEVKTSGFSYSNGVLTFSSAPPVVILGEDNMRVTYCADNLSTNITSETLSGVSTRYRDYSINNSRCVSSSAHLAGQGRYSHVYEGTQSSDTFTYERASFTLTNPKNIFDWEDIVFDPSGGLRSASAYNNAVTYLPTDDTFDDYEGSRTNTSSTWTAVTLYYSTSESDLNSAISNNNYSNYSSIHVAGTYTTTNKPSSYLCRDEMASIETDHQSNSQQTYYYAWQSMMDENFRKTSKVNVTVTYSSYVYTSTDDMIGSDKSAFSTCQRATVYGTGIINQIFMGASISNGYRSRMWYSAVGRPNYFPDINYVEVGSNDTAIMGMVKCGEYLGVVKAGNALDSSIYLAYPTSFDEDTTYVVRQSIAGIGALSTGAFNIISEEPVFLSSEGIMAIELAGENRLRNRSYFIDKRLCAEPGLSNAISYVYNNMYFLSINNHCYVLDGSQKSSWANEKTNLQYECYYLENIPAQCFGDMGGYLWFTDYDGNLCRFKHENDVSPYRDEYMVGHATIDADDMNSADDDGFTVEIGELQYTDGGTTHVYTRDELDIGMVVRFYSAGEFSITSLTDDVITLTKGIPVEAVWDTIADDDGAIHFFKNLNKKGFVVSLLPGSSSGVTVWLKPDEKDAIKYGTTDANGNVLPFDYFVRKKVKKYKRLQIICENSGLDQSFGVDQILKTYTLGNYSKNRK